MAASNNDVDITVVESESDDDSQSSEEFNFAVALQLRKNLSSTFEQHIHSSNVSDKIARFEQQSNNSDKLPPRPAVAVAVPAVKSTPLGVYLRVRPISSEHVATVNTIEIQPTTKQSQVPTTVRTFPPVDSNAYKVVREESSGGVKEFEFAQVFGPESTQQQVYNTVAAPLVSGLFPSSNSSTGESALLFAYGITNAGKTHTIMGSAKQKEMRGIIPRALQDIFSHMQSRTGYSLNMSYMEIYNEGIYDLLPKKEKTKTFVGASRESLKLRESRHGQTFVRGLAKHKVKSVEHGLELVQQASSKRHTSSNNINSDSSRSHCICQLEVSIESPIHSSVINSNDMEADDDDDNSVSTANGYNTDDEAVFLNKNKSVTLWIVDLAGSERSKRTGVIQGSTRQKEAALINSSLMKLMRCLNVMRRNQSTSMTANVVPFRESKLTHLFMNHLTGTSASRTLMIVNVNPAVADFDETQHVLAYATAARSVQISQEDFHRKRKDISAGGDALEATHDYNGRALKKFKSNNKGGAVTTSSTNGAASKISKLVKRFSPKNMAARKPAAVDGDSKKRKMMESQKESSKSLSSTDSVAGQPKLKTSRFANMRAQGKPKEAPSQQHGTTTASNKEIKQLKMSLSVAQAEAELLRSKKYQLEEQLSQHEAQVRMEIAQDMEEQMQIMREQYNGIIDNLKSQVHSNPTPSKSVKKAQMDKVDSLIDELMDKVDECKDEMKRMRKYGKAVGDKDKELSEVNSSHKQAVAKLEATIKDLQSKLETSQESYVKLEKSKKEMMENYELLIREQDEEETEDEYDSDGEESSRTPVRRGRQQQQETGGTKQMVRSVSQSTTGTSSSGTRTNSPESSSGSEENDEELWQSCSDLDVFSVELVTSIVNDGAEFSQFSPDEASGYLVVRQSVNSILDSAPASCNQRLLRKGQYMILLQSCERLVALLDDKEATPGVHEGPNKIPAGQEDAARTWAFAKADAHLWKLEHNNRDVVNESRFGVNDFPITNKNQYYGFSKTNGDPHRLVYRKTLSILGDRFKPILRKVLEQSDTFRETMTIDCDRGGSVAFCSLLQRESNDRHLHSMVDDGLVETDRERSLTKARATKEVASQILNGESLESIGDPVKLNELMDTVRLVHDDGHGKCIYEPVVPGGNGLVLLDIDKDNLAADCHAREFCMNLIQDVFSEGTYSEHFLRVHSFGSVVDQSNGQCNKLYLITEWGTPANVFLETKKNELPGEEFLALVKNVHHKALETSTFLHALGFSHFDIKLENIVIREKPGNDFHVVFIDFGSGQAGSSISIQLVDQITTPSCITPNLMFGTSAELCSQSRDVFTLSLHQLESYAGISGPCGLLQHIFDDLNGSGKVPEAIFVAMQRHWTGEGYDHIKDYGALENGMLTKKGRDLAGLAYAYLVLAHTEDRTVMNSIINMWRFTFTAAKDVLENENFLSATRTWSIELGIKFKCLRTGNYKAFDHVFRRLQLSIHPCGSVRPTAKHLFDAVKRNAK